MRTVAKLLLPVLCFFAVIFIAGCVRNAGGKAYFNGELTVTKDSVYFKDWANYIAMRLGEESKKKLGIDLNTADSGSKSYWAEFYGHIDDLSPKDTPEIDIVVHIDRLVKLEERDSMPEELLIVGFYECLIDGIKQQLIVHPDYIYTWTIYPNSKYEIITQGTWQRTADKEMLLTPFEVQAESTAPAEEMSYYGTVELNEDGEMVRMYVDSTEQKGYTPTPITPVSDSLLPESVRESRAKNREMLKKEDAKRRATPRPGVTRFEFDPDSQTLIEMQAGNPVFWKVYL